MQQILNVAVILAATAFLTVGPANSRGETPTETIRSELEAEGFVYSEDTFLSKAAAGQTSILMRFLDAGMNIEAADRDGRTALRLAIENEQWDAADLLLARGADPKLALQGIVHGSGFGAWIRENVEPLGSFSPVLIALVGLLFTHQYNKSQQRLAAQRADESQRLQLIQATEKMIPHLQSKEGASDAALVTLFNLADSDKLAIALAELYPGRAAAQKCIEILLRKGQSEESDAVKRALWVSLYKAAGEVGEVGVIELVDRLEDPDWIREIVNLQDAQGRTALMNASRENRGGNIAKLVERGADILASDRTGETALHWAAKYANRNALKSLLALTGDWDRKTKASFLNKKGLRGRTALEMARRNALDESDSNVLRAYQGVVERLQREHSSTLS